MTKNAIVISYHYLCDAIAAQIVKAHWCCSDENSADVCSKAIRNDLFHVIVKELMA